MNIDLAFFALCDLFSYGYVVDKLQAHLARKAIAFPVAFQSAYIFLRVLAVFIRFGKSFLNLADRSLHRLLFGLVLFAETYTYAFGHLA